MELVIKYQFGNDYLKYLFNILNNFRHGSEPAVSLTYSDKSSTNATISLGVADEVTRDSYHSGN